MFLDNVTKVGLVLLAGLRENTNFRGPFYEGDLAWQRILSDPTPNSALSKLADAVDSEVSLQP
jgi:hypothetical protein